MIITTALRGAGIASAIFMILLALGAPAAAQTPLSGATAVATGDLHACAVVNGGVKCWGFNGVGQLGDGSENDSPIAVDVVGLPSGSNVTAIAAGVEHTCAIADGGALCWGRNAEAQLGNGMPSIHVATPVPVVGLGPGSGVISIAAGQWFTCAVADGGVLCWGLNSYFTTTATPQFIVPAGSGASMVSASYNHACAVVDGGVLCWGFGDWGQLGNGDSVSTPLPVVALPAGSGVTSVAAGYGHSCATVSGGVKCWGSNQTGELGNGESGAGLRSLLPVDVVGFAGTPVMVAAGADHSCAVANGGVQCWGYNFQGALGNGAPNFGIDSNVPVGVVDLGPGSGTTHVAAGMYVTCAVANGGVMCWGYGGYGELGNGSLASSPVPVAVVTDNPAVNTAPDLGPVGISPAAVIPVGTSIDASATFTDPDDQDAHTCLVSWGDGSVDQPAPWLSSCGGSHAYSQAGVYVVTVGVTDAAGASDGSTYAYVVVYDPSAGFVTGGGLFESVPGAYRPDPTRAGLAHFGFVARYRNGRTTPEGNTEFQFTAGGLSFRSSSYEWLVISGARATYRGMGTINGGGDYGFQLTAMDGQLQGTGPDRIRIRIWDRASGATVYDNQTCGLAEDDADACTVVAEGEVVIHGDKK